MITAGATPTPKTIDQRRVALTSPQVKTLQTDNAGTLPDSQVRWMRATNVPVTDADGIARRCAATVEDITDRKMVEAQLVAAHEQLEKANTAKGEFLSRICLLYTSPSPRDRTRSRMPSSA